MTFFITPFHYTDCFSVRQIGYGGSAFYYFKILKPKKDAAKGSSSLDDLDFDEDDEETEVVETEQTEQEDDNL